MQKMEYFYIVSERSGPTMENSIILLLLLVMLKGS
ncbi:hypothetical protein Anas_05783 [Armadillidium nasatum]|uniref:Uncharacterized protein n=1 Tax=Armadillidium nasatum TaxID=96803 RepID=A0A5N5SRI2_9CRUS|nr:hypothetical protein Anas_05783 [Armadillidium nasatum]